MVRRPQQHPNDKVQRSNNKKKKAAEREREQDRANDRAKRFENDPKESDLMKSSSNSGKSELIFI